MNKLMRKVLIVFLLLALVARSVGQGNIPVSTIKQDYIPKNKSEKKAANILLASGTGLILTGFLIPKGEAPWKDLSYKNISIKNSFYFAGSFFVLISIPLYIVGAHHKKEDAALSFSVENKTANLCTPLKTVSINYPAVVCRLLRL